MFKSLIEWQFGSIIDYIDASANLISNEQKRINQDIDKHIKASPEDEDVIIDHFYDDIVKFEDNYPDLLFKSTFVSAHSLFVNLLGRTCKIAQHKIGSKFSYKDLKGSGSGAELDTFKRYMKKLMEFNLCSDELSANWNKLKEYNEIRNFIIHNSSCFIKDPLKSIENQSSFNHIKSNSHLEFSGAKGDYFKIISSNYILDFCDTAKGYLIEINNQLSDRFKD